MKKFLVCVAALGMLFTSCMRDDTRVDEGSVVTFNISAPAIGTRAEATYGDGVTAHDLQYAVFEADENGDPIGEQLFGEDVEGAFADAAMEYRLQLRLVKGKKYVSYWWAEAENAPFTVDFTTRKVTMNDDAFTANREDVDAFFKKHLITLDPNTDTDEQSIELRRPFAQLNIGVSDLAAAEDAGLTVSQTGVKVSVAKELNLHTGAVGEKATMEYKLADIPADKQITVDGTTYELISFNYLLVDGDAYDQESDEGEELVDVTLMYLDSEAGATAIERTFNNIQIERNHRTFILGGLFTEGVDFYVYIAPDWEDPDYGGNIDAGEITGVTAAAAAAYQSLTLTWDAVEDAEYYGITYAGEEIAQVNPDGTVRATEEAATTVSYTLPAGTITGASAQFTIKAHDKNDKVIASVITEQFTNFFTLVNRPEPELRVENGAFEMATDFDWTDGYGADYNEFGNLHENGILVAAEVRFYKNGATTPAYTAYATSADQTGAYKTWRTGFDYKYVKGSNMFMAFKNWQWKEGTGSYGTATATMPEFEKGTYTVDYTAHYIAVLGGVYNNKANDGTSNPDRLHFTAALESAVNEDVASLLEKAVARDGKSDLKVIKADGATVTAVAKGYQGATVTWEAVDGAASYKVFVGETEKASTTELTADVTGLTDANKYSFTVKAYDASNNQVSSGVSEEIQIWNVEGDLLPSPVIDMAQLAEGVLYLDATLDLTGVYKDITVKFTDANGNVAHKAYYSKYTSEGYNMDGQTTGNGENGGRFTYNFFGRYILPGATDGLWTWDDASEASAMPIFDAGEYTISYEATVWPIKNAYWSVSGEYDATKYASKLEAAGGDASKIAEKARVHFADSNDCLKEDIAKSGTFADKFVVSNIFDVTASIDEGTFKGASLVETDLTNYPGLASTNGLLEAAKIAWTYNTKFDKVVIAYNGKTVEINDGSYSNSTIIDGLKTSPVDFTVTFYDGATAIKEETVSTDVYVLPETAAGDWVATSFNSTHNGYKILGTGWNTTQYATAYCEFNVYEKDSNTPVYDKNIIIGTTAKSGLSWAMHKSRGVQYSAGGNYAVHGGDGNNWDTAKLPSTGTVVDNRVTYFQGLDSSKEYVVKFTLKVWPYIIDTANTSNVEFNHETKKGKYYFKRMRVDKAGKAENYYGAVDLSGEAPLTFK